MHNQSCMCFTACRTMCDCNHSVEHLCKRCSKCGLKTKKIFSKFCRFCKNEDNTKLECEICTLTKQQNSCCHDKSQLIRRCTKCSDQCEDLVQRHCSECATDFTFWLICKQCPENSAESLVMGDQPQLSFQLHSPGKDQFPDALVSSSKDQLPDDPVSSSKDQLSDDPVSAGREWLPNAPVSAEKDQFSNAPVSSSKDQLLDDPVSAGREWLPDDSASAGKDQFPNAPVSAGKDQFANSPVSASNDQLPDDPVSSGKDQLSSDPVSSSKDQLPDDPVSSGKDQLSSDPVSASKDQLPDDLVSAGRDQLPDDPVSSGKDQLSSDPVSASKDQLPDDQVSAGRDQLPDDLVSAGRDQLPDDLVSSSKDQFPHALVSSSKDQLSGDPVSAVKDQLPDALESNSKDQLPDDSVSAGKDQHPDDPASAGNDQYPDAPVSAVKDQLPEDLVSSSKDQLSGDPVSAVKDQLPDDSVSAGKDQHPDDTASAVKDQLPDDSVSAGKDQYPDAPVSAVKDQLPEDLVSSIKDQLSGDPVSAVKDQLPDDSVSAGKDQHPDDTASAVKDQLPDDSVSAGKDQLPDALESDSNDQLPDDQVSAGKDQHPDDTASAGKDQLPDDSVSAGKDLYPDAPVSAVKDQLPEDLVSSSKDQLSGDPVSAVKDQLPDDSVSAGKDQHPDDTASAVKDQLPDDSVSAGKDQLPDALESDSNDQLPDDQVSAGKDQHPDDTASAGKDQLPDDSVSAGKDLYPDAPVSAVKDQLPEDLVSSSKDQLSGDPVSAVKDQLPDDSVSAGKDQHPDDTASAVKDQLPDDSVSAGKDQLPDALESDSNDQLPDDQVSAGKDQHPDDTASAGKDQLPDDSVSAGKDQYPDAPVSAVKDQLPEDLVSSSKDQHPDYPASAVKDQLPDDSVSAGKDQLPDDPVSSSKDQLRNAPVLAGKQRLPVVCTDKTAVRLSPQVSNISGAKKPVSCAVDIGKLIKKLYPNHQLSVVKLRFHILNECFKQFDQSMDKIVLMFGNVKELGGRNASQSLFVIGAESLEPVTWVSQDRQEHYLTSVCYEFPLPTHLLRDGVTFEYVIQKSQPNGSSYLEEERVGDRILKLSSKSHEKLIHFDGVVRSQEIPKDLSTITNCVNKKFLAMNHDLLGEHLLKELAQKQLPPKVIFESFNFRLVRACYIEDSSDKELCSNAVKSVIEKTTKSPVTYGLSESINKSSVEWQAALELAVIAVRHGLFKTEERRSLIKERDIQILMRCMLPPVNRAKEEHDYIVEEQHRIKPALQEILVYALCSDNLVFELLFVLPSYFMYSAATVDSELISFQSDKAFFKWCGLGDLQADSIVYFRRNELEFAKLEKFLAEYGDEGDLLSRFFIATMQPSRTNDLLEQKGFSPMIKLVAITRNSRIAGVKVEGATFLKTTQSVMAQLSEANDIELHQYFKISCELIYVYFIDCYLEPVTENRMDHLFGCLDLNLRCTLELTRRRLELPHRFDFAHYASSLAQIIKSSILSSSIWKPTIMKFNAFFVSLSTYQNANVEKIWRTTVADVVMDVLLMIKKENLLCILSDANTMVEIDPAFASTLLRCLFEHSQNVSFTKFVPDQLRNVLRSVLNIGNSKAVCKVLSSMVEQAYQKFNASKRQGLSPELFMALEWPFASPLIAELNTLVDGRNSLTGKLSKTSLKIIESCSENVQQLLTTLRDRPQEIKYEAVEQIKLFQDALETIGIYFEAKFAFNVKERIDTVVLLKSRLDERIEHENKLLTFCVTCVDSALIDDIPDLNGVWKVSSKKSLEELDKEGLSRFPFLTGLLETNQEATNLLDKIKALQKSVTFRNEMKEHSKRMFDERQDKKLTSEELIKCLIEAFKTWEEKIKRVCAPKAPISNSTDFFKQLLGNARELENEIMCIRLIYPSSFSEDFGRKLHFVVTSHAYSNISRVLKTLFKNFNIQHSQEDEELLQQAEDFSKQLCYKSLNEVIDVNLDRFRHSQLEVIKQKGPNFLQALSVISASHEFIKWVRSNVQKGDLNTFIDLAMIYLGDSGESDKKKIEMFVRVVYDFDEIIYKLGSEEAVRMDVRQFVEFCTPMSRRINENHETISNLQNTATRLSWIREIKENQGSVEKSTIKKIESIMTSRGRIRIGCLVKKDDPFVLELEGASHEGTSHEAYELSDIKELQSKLMLIAGETFEKRCLLSEFVSLTESIFHLVEVYKKFQVNSCVLCEQIQIEVHLPLSQYNQNEDKKDNLTIELRFCSPHIKISYKYRNLRDGLAKLSNCFQDCLLQWNNEVWKLRKEFFYLNFFSLKQIKYLQTELAPMFLSTNPIKLVDRQLSDLLHYIHPGITPELLSQAVDDAVLEKAKRTHSTPNEPNENAHDRICAALQDEGYNEEIVSKTVKLLFRYASPEETHEALKSKALDLAVKLEKNKLTASDTQQRQNWKTADEELSAAGIGNATADEAFKNLWEIYLLNIRSSYKDFISFGDANLFLELLSQRAQSLRVSRVADMEFKRLFNRRTPVAYCLEAKNHLLIALQLFEKAYRCLPQLEDIILCHEGTTEEELVVFLHRALLDPSENSVYAILNADQLSYNISVVAEERFSKLINSVDGLVNSHLFILVSTDNQSQFPFCNFIRKFEEEILFEPSIEEMNVFTSKTLKGRTPQESKFLWITSSRSGMGKSLVCENFAGESAAVFASNTDHLCVDELVTVFQKESVKGKTVFHLDIAREVQTGFDSCMTQLAIFGAVVDSNGVVWRRKTHELYLLEHSENLLFSTRCHFLSFLPKIECLTPSESLQVALQANETNVWRPFLNNELKKFKVIVEFFFTGKYEAEGADPTHTQLTDAQTLDSLLKNCGIENPSWSDLSNFVHFLHTQLEAFRKSWFCKKEAEHYFPGFRKFVVDCILLMSKDFSTRSLDIDDESETRHHTIDNSENRCPLEAFQLKRHWEQESHPYLLFNQDGESFTFIGFTVNDKGDLVDSTSGTTIKKNIMTPNLRLSLLAQRVPLDDRFEDLSQNEKVRRMRNVFGFNEENNLPDFDSSYELTMDNVKKILAIYMRFRSNIPVVIMGETGCGKTRLVSFLTKIMLPIESDVQNMTILKIHGGITASDIERHVSEAEILAKKNFDLLRGNDGAQSISPYTVLFFDEINTTSFVGLIKEIMMDGRINGRKIDFAHGLRCVAACNPYRKHSDDTIRMLENSGLGYRVRKEKTVDKFGNIPMRHLVYRVKPLPLSLISVLWDFGMLSEDAERKYVVRMVASGLNGLSEVHRNRLTNAICESQKFMRSATDETQFVSLRDVERVIVIYQWLSKDILEKEESSSEPAPALEKADCHLLMALASSYQSRLSSKRKSDYTRIICEALEGRLTASRVEEVIEEFQSRLLSKEVNGRNLLPDYVANNDALRENVFMMTMCICLRIPLFIVGKPGSSKSLGKTIVKNNMKGENSEGGIFRKLPDTQMLSFQCSPWSTSDGITKLFQQCAKQQMDKGDDRNFVSVVVLDEIGLAEDTPQMSLKVLHSLLEDGVKMDAGSGNQRVAFVGISNWALDPAKMNRGLFVLRDVPTTKDLIQTAKDICKGTNLKSSRHLLDLTTFFQKQFSGDRLKREFFGLRDYFSAVKHLAQKAKDSLSELTDADIANCLLRNFSGLEDINPLQLFFSEVRCGVDIPVQYNSVLKEALEAAGPDQRYLLLITENTSGFKVLKRLLGERNVTIIFGSSFPKDQEYSKVCLNINRIKQCMERGDTVVLMNLESLYESLYDVLNLSRETLGNDLFVDIGLGTHRVKSKIHKDFKIFVVADDKTVSESFPIPLINRLEKHKLSWKTMLEPDMLLFCDRFKEWLISYLPPEEKRTTGLSWCFVGYHDDVIPSLAIEENCNFEVVQHRVLSAATPDGLIRLDATPLRNEKAALLRNYYEENGLGCLAAFLNSYKMKKPLLQVTTFDCILSSDEQKQLEVLPCFENARYKNISQFETELQFKDFLRQHMNGQGLLVLQYEGLQQNLNFQNVVSSVKFIIEESYLADQRRKEEECAQASSAPVLLQVILIIKLIRSHSNPFTGLDCGLWHCVHIEELVSSNRLNIPLLDRLTIPKLFERPLPDEAEECSVGVLGYRQPANIRLLMNKNLLPALSLLRDKDSKQNRLADRKDTVSSALKDDEFLRTALAFMHKALTTMDENSVSTISPEQWLCADAASSKKVKEAGTFIESIWRVLKRKTAPALVSFLAFADMDENLTNYRRPETRALWLMLAPHAARLEGTMKKFVKSGPAVEVARVEVPSSAVDGHHFAAQFPFSWAIVKQLESLTKQSTGGSAPKSLNLSILDSEMGMVLAKENISDSLLTAFCHDLLHICVSSITNKEVDVLQAVLLRTVKNSLNEQKTGSCVGERKETLAMAILSTFQALKKYVDHVNMLVRLEHRVSGMTGHMKALDNFQVLPSEIFKAVSKHFEVSRHDLNKALTRKEWLARVDKSRTIIERLLFLLKDSAMKLQWDKINCVALFLRNVTSHFDREGLNESTIKPIRLWTSLWASADVKFQDKTGILEIEKFLERMREELTDLAVGTYVCSQCNERTDRLTSLPCKDSLCTNCYLQCAQSDSSFTCVKCHVPFDARLVNCEIPEMLVQLKARCHSFVMEVVSTLCFSEGHPPNEELCNHFLSYVTRSGRDKSVIGYFSDDKDDSPMFRSFILQQLMRYNSDEVVRRLEEHILGADQEVGEENKHELRLIVLNCLEDSIAMEKAKNEVVELSMPTMQLQVNESSQVAQISELRAIAAWRVDLHRLASRLANRSVTESVRVLLTPEDSETLIATLRAHRWSRVFFLRCLCMVAGTCATLQRIQTDDLLVLAYEEELREMRASVWVPDFLRSHSEAYCVLKRYLLHCFVTGDFKSQEPVEIIETSNSVLALVLATFSYELQGDVNQKRLQECVKHILNLMSKETKSCYAYLQTLKNAPRQTLSAAHQSILLVHLAYELYIYQNKSDYVKFLQSLWQNYHQWYLPAMEHDRLFEIMTKAGIDAPRPGAFKCPKGHLYFVGECAKPMETSTCPDCGCTIGGKHHVPVAGNEKYVAADQTSKGLVEARASEPVRQLPGCAVALIRMMIGLALQLGDHSRDSQASSSGGTALSPAEKANEDGREEFTLGLRLFCDATGRSTEDALHTLHLVFARLGNQANRSSVGFDLKSDAGRRNFEDRLYNDLLREIVESLSRVLRNSNRTITQDDDAQTLSNIGRLIHETSELDTQDNHVALLWRYRQPITIQNAAHSFTELRPEMQNQFRLANEFIASERVLRHLHHLPALVKLAKELVTEWKHNRELKDALRIKLKAAAQHNPSRSEAVRTFIVVWNDLHDLLAERSARFLDDSPDGKTWIAFEITNYNAVVNINETPLAALLPHRKSWGRCIVGLIQLLVDTHNAILDACEDSEPDEIHLELIDQASVVTCDPDKDLMAMLLANSSYSLKRKACTEVTYNFLGLQQQLRERVVRGRPRIRGYLPEMVYSEDFNLMEIFQQLDSSGLKQETEVDDANMQNALHCNLPTPILTALLDDSLKVAINFLISLAPSNSELLLDDFMCKTLHMDSGLPTDALKRNVKISQTRLLWMSLDHLRWRQLAQDGFDPFETDFNTISDQLSQEQLQTLPHELRNRRSLLLDKLHRLIRLELRSLPSSVRDYPLNRMSDFDPAFELAFKDLPDWVEGKHACQLWSEAFSWADE